MYANGTGVPQDDIRAYAWFNVAAAKGHKNAAIQRDAIEKRLTVEQKTEAQNLSADLPGKLPKQ